MDTDQHAFVNHIAWRHEQTAAILQEEQRVADTNAVVLADQHAVTAAWNRAAVRAVAVKHVADEPCAARQVHKFVLETNQSARRAAVLEAGTTTGIVFHVEQFCATLAECLHDATLMAFFDVYSERFHGLVLHAVDHLEQHLWFAHCELVAFAAHVFNQDRQVQFATTGDAENVGVFSIFNFQRNVGEQFFL